MSGEYKQNARASDRRRGLAEQLESLPIAQEGQEPRRPKLGISTKRRDGMGREDQKGFVKLVEEVVPGIKQTIKAPDLVTEHPRLPGRKSVDQAIAQTPHRPPASPDDAIAREAVARCEERDGFESCAVHRRHGAFDGDDYHKAALEAVRLATGRTPE